MCGADIAVLLAKTGSRGEIEEEQRNRGEKSKASGRSPGVIGVLNSAIATYYYLRFVVTTYMHRHTEGQEPLPRIAFVEGLALTSACLGTLYLGIFPSKVLGYIEKGIEMLVG